METIKNYTAEVTRVDTFEISIDENVWNNDALTAWSSVFFKVESVGEIASHLASLVARLGSLQFYEGFGRVRTILKDGYEMTQWKKDDNGTSVKVKLEDYCNGIVVRIISEDDECDVEIKEPKSVNEIEVNT